MASKPEQIDETFIRESQKVQEILSDILTRRTWVNPVMDTDRRYLL